MNLLFVAFVIFVAIAQPRSPHKHRHQAPSTPAASEAPSAPAVATPPAAPAVPAAPSVSAGAGRTAS